MKTKIKKINKYIYLSLILLLVTNKAIATEYFVVKDLNQIFKPATEKKANATCFFYENNKYKCACLNPTNLRIWASGDISRIKGFSNSIQYGKINDCTD